MVPFLPFIFQSNSPYSDPVDGLCHGDGTGICRVQPPQLHVVDLKEHSLPLQKVVVQAHMCSNEYYFSEIYHYIILVVLYSELKFLRAKEIDMVSMLQLRYLTLFIPELGAEVGNRYIQ